MKTSPLFPHSIKKLCFLDAFALLTLCLFPVVLQAQIPQQINYQGRVSVRGINFNGTGQFKFALVDAGTSFGDTATATAIIENGVVTAVNVDSSGTNYAAPPAITFGGPGAGATATASLNLGIVSFITVTNGGGGYTTPPVVTIAPPAVTAVYNAYWCNDGSTSVGTEPTAAVALPVVNGLYSVALGDPALGMVPFYQPIFDRQLYLRVWFSDGVHGFQQLSPDQKLGSSPYASRAKLAENVLDGSIGSASLAAGSVGAVSLANGAVSATKLAAGAVDASKLADGAVSTAKLAPGTVENIVQNVLGAPAIATLNGGVVLSPDPDSSSLAAAGYVKIGSQSFSTESWVGLNFAPPPPPPTLSFPQSVWTGTELLVFGNREVEWEGRIFAYKYNPETFTWVEMGSIPGSLEGASVVNTGTEVLFWGVNYVSQANPDYPFSWSSIRGYSGGVGYRIAAGSWRTLSASNQPALRSGFSAVWTGTSMIIWGGVGTLVDEGFLFGTFNYSTKAQSNGGSYNPVSDTWTPVFGGPAGRTLHSATWAVTEMVVWGGAEWVPNEDPELGDGDFIPRNTGAAYNPFTGQWRDLPTLGAPAARFGHTAAVGSGALIHIFGGSSAGGGATYNWFANTWSAMSSAGQPQGNFRPAVATTGTKVFVWGGATSSDSLYSSSPTGELNTPVNTGAVYNKNTNTWTAIATTGAPAALIAPVGVWTGSQALVYGGLAPSANLPATLTAWDEVSNTWSALDGTPAPRRLAQSVWTGGELLYWGGANSLGQMRSGGRIDPASSSHHLIPLLNAPSARIGHAIVWTGTEMLVWGGQNQAGGAYPTDASRYRRSTNAWSPMNTAGAPSSRKDHSAVWTGGEMIVWGGVEGNGSSFLASGGRYNPASDSWQPLPTAGTPPIARSGHTAIWTGTEMIVWGGTGSAGPLGDGARFNPATNQWTSLSATGAPTARAQHTATWTGSEMIVWGGLALQGGVVISPNTGARYAPATNSWTPLPTANAPVGRVNHTAVWSGSELIVWGGMNALSNPVYGDGARFSLALNSWQPITDVSAPTPRQGHTTFWTGSAMITLFGQATGGTNLADATRYSPPATVHYYLKLNP